jgi:hypothetical protein
MHGIAHGCVDLRLVFTKISDNTWITHKRIAGLRHEAAYRNAKSFLFQSYFARSQVPSDADLICVEHKEASIHEFTIANTPDTAG